MSERMFVGIDVSKDTLAVAWGGVSRSYGNDDNAHEALAKDLKETGTPVDMIVVEPSGGYEALCVCNLQAAGFTVALVNAKQARDFAKGLGFSAKTDRVDALMLERFAKVLADQPNRERYIKLVDSEEQQALHALVLRRRQLVEMLVAERLRLSLSHRAARKSIRELIQTLKQMLIPIDREMASHINEHYADLAKLLESVKGIGPVSMAVIIGSLPELGRLTGRQISSLVGVAPHPRESGTWKGQRSVSGGRAQVRTMLYMATLTAARSNDVIKGFYQRLIAKGKPKKVALIACMRKLLVILNAMVRTGKPWDSAMHAT